MSALEVVPPDGSELRPNGWWAIYTRHQHEKTVAEMLEAKGCEVFLPQYEETRRWRDRKMTLSLPLFPCYLFIRSAPAYRLHVISTPGVQMIVRRGNQFAIIPPDEIQALQRAMHAPSGIEPHPFLKCGERVRVIRGALEGVEGILLRKKNHCRLVLSVDLLARSAAVEVDSADVILIHMEAARRFPPTALTEYISTKAGPSGVVSRI